MRLTAARSRSTSIRRASARSAVSTCTATFEQQSGRSFERADLERACNSRWLELMNDQPLLPGIASCVVVGEGTWSEAGGCVELDRRVGDTQSAGSSGCSIISMRSARATMSRGETGSGALPARAREARCCSWTRRLPSRIRQTAFSPRSGPASSVSRFPIR